jgi:alpha-mannosidase
MLVFGWGDGGGGPTRDHLEFLRRARDLEGVPRTRIASPVEFFRDLEKRGALEKRYVGELYYQCHRGTYTAQARTKKANRQCEFALREAELWGAAAAALKGFRWPAARMDTAWKAVLLNQFHDILPGSAIERVYQEALAAYDTVLKAAAETTQSAVAKLVRRTPDAATVFNSLSWERTVLAPLPKGFRGAESSDGVALPVQRIDGIAHAEVRVPPCGWTTLRRGKPARAAGDLRATPSLLENEFLRVRFNRKGEVTSIFDKETGREIAAGACNRFCMYKDVPPFADAWDIDSMYPRTPVALEGAARIEALDAGPLVARIRVSRRLRESAMTQTISLRRGSRRVDFATQIDWRESHKMLKVNFPVRIHTSEGVHEIQFGHLRRPNHKSRPFDADRFEVPNHKWSAIAEEDRGFALLNDCKYGVNVDGNSINLTLLKSPLAPDANADKGAQTFTYSFYVWNGSFAECGVVREAYDLNCAPLVVRGAAGEASLFSVDAPNVIVETVKLAEDGSGDVVVRLYEAKRMATRCVLRAAIPFRAATQTDMLEEHPKPLKARNGRIALDFRPFEVKTLRLRA